jgi:hypothetical protein
MSPGAQSRDNIRDGGGYDQRDTASQRAEPLGFVAAVAAGQLDRGGYGLPLAIGGVGRRRGRPNRRVVVGEVVMQLQRHVVAGGVEAAVPQRWYGTRPFEAITSKLFLMLEKVEKLAGRLCHKGILTTNTSVVVRYLDGRKVP